MGYKFVFYSGMRNHTQIERDDSENPEFRTLQMAKDALLPSRRKKRDEWAYEIEQVVQLKASDLED